MRNEEKAKELRLKYIDEGCGDSTDIRCACEDMAEWKDKQLKEYLEKKKEKFKKERDILTDLDAISLAIERLHYIDILNEIINELFGETVEVDHSNNDE